MILNGPIKSYESVFKILNSGGLVNADSYDDLELIKSACQKIPKNKKIRLGIRIRFDSPEFNSRFGILINENSINLLKNFLKDTNINFFMYPYALSQKRN